MGLISYWTEFLYTFIQGCTNDMSPNYIIKSIGNTTEREKILHSDYGSWNALH